MLHATTAERQHTQEDMLPVLLKWMPSKKWLLTIETILAIVELEPVEEASILKGPSWKGKKSCFLVSEITTTETSNETCTCISILKSIHKCIYRCLFFTWPHWPRSWWINNIVVANIWCHESQKSMYWRWSERPLIKVVLYMQCGPTNNDMVKV